MTTLGQTSTPAHPAEYSAASKALHWVMAAMILVQLPVGIWMTTLSFDQPNTGTIYNLHKSSGLVLFSLAVLRVLYRHLNGVPPKHATLSKPQRIVSSAVHHSLYLLIFIVPIAGWIATSMCCKPVLLFGLVDLTLPVGGNMDSSKPIFVVHKIAAILMAVLMLTHIGAALMHALLMRDGVINRMVPRALHGLFPVAKV